MFVAGIDGGGTHTRLEVREDNNQLLGRWEFGPFNLNAIGENRFLCLLEEAFAACGDMSQCASLCIGAAGISNPRMKALLEKTLQETGFRGRLKLCGDQEIALRGAMDTPGIVLIAGTGSICFGKNAAGKTARSGGYGHLIDDGGSGYALGRDVLAEAVRTADGRSGCVPLLERVYAKLNARSPEEIAAFVHHPDTDKAKIAAFSAIALELSGDPAIAGLLDRNARELVALVRAVQARLDLQNCSVALMGGLLETENPYRRMVANKLSEVGKPATATHDALWGAAQIAWECGK